MKRDGSRFNGNWNTSNGWTNLRETESTTWRKTMGTNTEDFFNRLKAPFPIKRLHWRVGATNAKKVQRETGNSNARPTKGIALAYIDARDVMKRLDDVAGPGNWQNRYTHLNGNGCVCEIGIRLNDEWLWRANGAGETQTEAEKGAMSDAFKRAAVMWGIGRYLYYLPNVWVDLNERGQIKETPALPDWAIPGGS